MDIAHYRRAEALARHVSPSWRHEQAQRPTAFAADGFPIRVESTADLLQITDSMHEARFQAYQEELGGLDDDDVDLLVRALADYAAFAAATFHTDRVVLPLSPMMAHLALHSKISAWPICQDVLEIGPGCGYLPFFRGPNSTYHQIEVTESLYMLQHLVNAWCYGDVAEMATFAPVADVNLFAPGEASNVEQPITVPVSRQPSCYHWPWWKIGRVADHQFCVVTANANLSEMTEAALAGFARLIERVLRPSGALIVQCFGGGATPINKVVSHLMRNGLQPLALMAGTAGKSFVVPNAVFVRQGPVTPPAWDGRPIFPQTDPRVRRVYRLDRPISTIYTGAEIAKLVTERLQGSAVAAGRDTVLTK